MNNLNLNDMDYFACLLYNKKSATLVSKNGKAYVYCDDDKIDISDAKPQSESDFMVGDRKVHTFDSLKPQTLRGILSCEWIPASGNEEPHYYVAFIEVGNKRKQEVVMLKFGMCLPEEDQQHIG